LVGQVHTKRRPEPVHEDVLGERGLCVSLQNTIKKGGKKRHASQRRREKKESAP